MVAAVGGGSNGNFLCVCSCDMIALITGAHISISSRLTTFDIFIE